MVEVLFSSFFLESKKKRNIPKGLDLHINTRLSMCFCRHLIKEPYYIPQHKAIMGPKLMSTGHVAHAY